MITGISYCDNNFDKYTEWLKFFGINYLILDYRINNPEKLNYCRGLILTGGVDIYPELYADWENAEDKGSYKPERDGFEMKLLESALGRKIPVLGICRGCQLINVFFRGTLIYDIGQIRGGKHTADNNGIADMHDIIINENTMLYDIIKSKKCEVNSTHHQAVDRLGEGLISNCRASDGIIEGIEFQNKIGKPFLLGIQWHPELYSDKGNITSENVINGFISAMA